MYKQIRTIVAGFAMVLATSSAIAQRAVLVELFTSEGCSSCPPADALLKQVNGTRTHGGELIVGISEHVTYWNSLGWQDPFSSSLFTDRQNAYSERFHLEGPYTPQMVINGAEQIVGSDRTALARAVRAQEDQHAQLSLRILSMSLTHNTLTVNLSSSGELPPHGADLIAVLTDDSDQSNVLRGENSGRDLVHVAVARSFTRVARVQATGEKTIEVPIPASIQSAPGHHIILFVQTPDNGRVLGIDTKPL
jgi:hypothetical protein